MSNYLLEADTIPEKRPAHSPHSTTIFNIFDYIATPVCLRITVLIWVLAWLKYPFANECWCVMATLLECQPPHKLHTGKAVFAHTRTMGRGPMPKTSIQSLQWQT